MSSARDVTTFTDPEPPPGASPWVDGHGPAVEVSVVDPDPAWPDRYAALERRIRAALGPTVRLLEHTGSTSVPGLPAKPVIDVMLVVADPSDEDAYVPALEREGFVLVVREPWWHEHRCLRHADPACNLHVHAADSPEVVRHRMFREWLREHPQDRELYAAVKRTAAAEATAAGEHVMQYNARKEEVVREIYARAFRAAGLLGPSSAEDQRP